MKRKPRYKKGDLIQIKPARYFENHPVYDKGENSILKGSGFTMPYMKRFCGNIYKIVKIDKCENIPFYIYKLGFSKKTKISNYKDVHIFNFNEWMFDDMIKEKIKKL